MSNRKIIYKKKGNVIKDLTRKLLKLLNQDAKNSFNYKQIAAKLELDDTQSRNQIKFLILTFTRRCNKSFCISIGHDQSGS